MDDAELMRFSNRFTCLKHVVAGLLIRQRTAHTNEIGKIEPVEELHHDVWRESATSSARDIDDAHDMLVLDLRAEASLAKESLEVLIIHRFGRMKNLHRDNFT